MYILEQSDPKFTSVLLFGDTSFDNNKNTFFNDVAIDYTFRPEDLMNLHLTVLE